MEGEGGGEGTWTQGGTSEAPQSTPEPGTGAAATRSIRVIGCYRRRSARGCTRVPVELADTPTSRHAGRRRRPRQGRA